MTTFFTSDWHLFHKKIHEYCPFTRRGSSPKEMSQIILGNINSQVKPGDIIYNLGDVSFGSTAETLDVLGAIKDMGVVHHLVLGNHDHNITKNENLLSMFDSVQLGLNILHMKRRIDMTHMPKVTWDRARYGGYHLHGHRHSSYQPVFNRALDVGIDSRATGDMKMYTFEEIEKIMSYCDIRTTNH